MGYSQTQLKTPSRLNAGRFWLDFLCEDAASAMNRDRALFEEVKAGGGSPVIRFYRWQKPTLSYGKVQGLELQTQARFLAEGWELVQRPTGGGNVFHKDDVCFTVIWKKDEPAIPWAILDSYRAIHLWIRSALKELGFESELFHKEEKFRSDAESWCFKKAVCYDLVAEGKKVVGGAQWRERNAALHQGAIQISGFAEKFSRNPEKNILTFKNAFSALLSPEIRC